MPKQYTTQQVADILNITDGRVRQLAKALCIDRKFGRARYFTPGDIDRMRQRNTAPGPRPRKEGQG
jgi:hypothetical protein